jgi:hypothetical protein
VVADAGIQLASRQTVSVVSRRLSVHSGAGELLFDTLDVVANNARACVDKLAVIADSCDGVFERLTQRAKRVYRFVEELDQLRARQLDYRADDVAQIRGRHTVMTARQIAKIDGEQIHVG